MLSSTFPLLGGEEGGVLLAFSECGSGLLLSTLQHTEQFLQPGVICFDGNSPEFGELCLAGGHIKKIKLEFSKIQLQKRMMVASLLHDNYRVLHPY